MTVTFERFFTCPICEERVATKYPPPIEPNCPSCGERMLAEGSGSAMAANVYCPQCGEMSLSYVGRQCAKCGGTWLAFTSRTTSLQDPDSAFNAESGPIAGRPRNSSQTSWPS